MTAPLVKLSPMEQFINFMTHHTDLYIRGSKGKDWAESRALEKKLASDLKPFFERLRADDLAEIEKLRAERDHYRAALERIASFDFEDRGDEPSFARQILKES